MTKKEELLKKIEELEEKLDSAPDLEIWDMLVDEIRKVEREIEGLKNVNESD